MIDVIAIDPKSRCTIHVPWRWLIVAAAAAAVAVVGWLTLQPAGAILKLVPAISAVASVAGLVMAIRETSKKLVFVSRHAHVPLLELELNQPDPRRFNDFIGHLKQRIADARTERKLAKERCVAGEMRMLRRLTQAGVFERTAYRAARSRLLEKF